MSNDSITSRRMFLNRLWRCLALALTGSAVGLASWDRRGTTNLTERPGLLTIPSFDVDGQAGKLAVARGSIRSETIAAALAALGGVSAFVRPGDNVLLKVNAAFATPAAVGATTHPDVVTALVDQCLNAGAARVAVADNPINDPASCFELTGIGPAARQAGAQVMLPSPNRFDAFSLEGAQLIQNWPVFAKPLLWADKVIGLAPVKDHHRSGASMTIKNWYGLLGGRRNIFHQQIHTIIAELGMMIKPTLVILDGTWSMMANGPTGGSMDDLKETRTIIAGTDAVAVDAFGATLLGKTAEDLPHLLMAEKAGVGTVDFGALNPVEVKG